MCIRDRVIACSDSNGYIVDESGIDLDLVKEIKEIRRERISQYARRKGNDTHYIEGGSIWDVPCDVAMPSATQNELTGKDARALVKNGVVAVGEGANMPCTPDAVREFQGAGVLFGPGKAANAGSKGAATGIAKSCGAGSVTNNITAPAIPRPKKEPAKMN